MATFAEAVVNQNAEVVAEDNLGQVMATSFNPNSKYYVCYKGPTKSKDGASFTIDASSKPVMMRFLEVEGEPKAKADIIAAGETSWFDVNMGLRPFTREIKDLRTKEGREEAKDKKIWLCHFEVIEGERDRYGNLMPGAYDRKKWFMEKEVL